MSRCLTGQAHSEAKHIGNLIINNLIDIAIAVAVARRAKKPELAIKGRIMDAEVTNRDCCIRDDNGTLVPGLQRD